MALTAARKSMMVGKRTQALSVMYLTRRTDLAIVPADDDVGIDLIVRIVGKKKTGLRQFGVKVCGSWDKPDTERVEKLARSAARALNARRPIPVSGRRLLLLDGRRRGIVRMASRAHRGSGRRVFTAAGRCSPMSSIRSSLA